MIIDEAHSLLEPETLIVFSWLKKPVQVILVGSEELPKPLCFSLDNCSTTHYNKSLFVRMIEREFHQLELKH